MNANMKQDHPQAAEAQRWMDARQAGADYANGLKVGDVFRGSHGEADHRGYSEQERQAFGGGAIEVIKTLGIWTDNDHVIVRLDRH